MDGRDVRVLASARIRTEARGGLMSALPGFLAATRAEPGCLGYDMLVDATDACRLATIEPWADRAAAVAHLGAEHTRAFLALLAEATDGTAPAITLLAGTAERLG